MWERNREGVREGEGQALGDGKKEIRIRERKRGKEIGIVGKREGEESKCRGR